MRRYAFIDVQNTASTTQNMLGFLVDWTRLAEYLKNKKSCTEILFYTGIENGDVETAKEFDSVSKIPGCIVRSKTTFAYKNKDKTIALNCIQCGQENIHTIDMGYRKKSNCDVELSVDVMERASKDAEFLLFTGDGDFEYLIRKALEKKVQRVYLYAYAGKYIRSGMTVSSYSTKLRALVDEKRTEVFYTSLKDIAGSIKKDIQK